MTASPLYIRKRAASIRTSWASQTQQRAKLSHSFTPAVQREQHMWVLLCCGTRKTHGISFYRQEERGIACFFFKKNTTFPLFWLRPPFLRTAVVFWRNDFHTKRDATCSRAALAVRGNLEVDREFTHPSDVRHSPVRSVLATITHGCASFRRVFRALTLHLWLSQIINTHSFASFLLLITVLSPSGITV